jgi:hypothetical protein
MSTIYDQLAKLAEQADNAFLTWEEEMSRFSCAFHNALLEQLGWPEAFQAIKYDKRTLPEGTRIGPLGYADSSGFHFGIAVTVGRAWADFHFVSRKSAEGAYEVEEGNAAVVLIDLNDKSTVEPIAKRISETLRAKILQLALAKQTGFVGSSRAG